MQGYRTDAAVLFTEESSRLPILATLPLDIHEAITALSTNVILRAMHSDVIISNPLSSPTNLFPQPLAQHESAKTI